MRGHPYIYRHLVCFEETNLVGNVYYANHIRWQGRCREMFLRDHAPGILNELRNGLALITVRCSCEYLDELMPFDNVEIRMYLKEARQNRLTLDYEYFRTLPSDPVLVATGEQQIACMERNANGLKAIEIPAELRMALAQFERR